MAGISIAKNTAVERDGADCRFQTVQRTALDLGFSVRQVYDLVAEGRIPSIRGGAAIRVPCSFVAGVIERVERGEAVVL